MAKQAVIILERARGGPLLWPIARASGAERTSCGLEQRCDPWGQACRGPLLGWCWAGCGLEDTSLPGVLLGAAWTSLGDITEGALTPNPAPRS